MNATQKKSVISVILKKKIPFRKEPDSKVLNALLKIIKAPIASSPPVNSLGYESWCTRELHARRSGVPSSLIAPPSDTEEH